MLQEERQIYREKNGNQREWFYERDLLLPCGQLRNIQVPRSRDGGLKSPLLPQRRRSVPETELLIRAMILAGVSTRKTVEVFKKLWIYRASDADSLLRVHHQPPETGEQRKQTSLETHGDVSDGSQCGEISLGNEIF